MEQRPCTTMQQSHIPLVQHIRSLVAENQVTHLSSYQST